jgi:hypothetical protein
MSQLRKLSGLKRRMTSRRCLLKQITVVKEESVRAVFAAASKFLFSPRPAALADLLRTEGSYPDYPEWLMKTKRTMIQTGAAGLGVALVPEQLKNLPHDNVVFRPINPAVRTEGCVAWKAMTSHHCKLTWKSLSELQETAAGKRRNRKIIPASFACRYFSPAMASSSSSNVHPKARARASLVISLVRRRIRG